MLLVTTFQTFTSTYLTELIVKCSEFAFGQVKPETLGHK